MTVRYYSSVAAETTLVGSITNVSATMQVVSAVGLPALTPFTVAVDYEGATEELVEVTNVAGDTLTITRGIDGTSAASHNAGARVRHVSSARDFADSRTHENSTDGVHGLDPGSDIVGTDDVQTLTNKTFIDATGTFNRIDVFSEGVTAWTTTVYGDVDHNVNLMEWKRSPADTNAVAAISNNGALTARNATAGADALTNTYRIRIAKSNGSTDIYSVLSGGSVVTFTDDTIDGFVVKPRTASNAKAFNVRNSTDSADIFVVNNNGRVLINGTNAPSVQLEVNGTSGQSGPVVRVSAGTGGTGRIQEWINAAGATPSFIDSTGVATFPSSLTIGGMTPSVGWDNLLNKRRRDGAVVAVMLGLTRTGADIVVPASGNITPDLQIATVPSGWFDTTDPIMVHASTGVNSGGARINSDGTVDLVDWTPGATIQTGANLRFNYTFML